ncbi:hypothetical protein A7P96_05210 [Eikenella sp. NML03-A-027]|uniref:hypothetical protein n=1 Tax=Eikenella sp. NML03-A-027 TaxID=1795828 RepID=UPI0007E039CA|nr:hypothetical protein [Eikenella sp. NML03-A-027]OAM31435.1 hypothetical protein A7P96_05210 [Eikenella sp. NML03-A-027]
MPAAAAVISAVASAVGTGYSIYSGERSAKKQAQAQAQAERQAEKQALQAERDFNKANSKKANTAGLLQAAQQDGGGVGSTMLTGSEGVGNDKLKLGRQGLLGKTSLLG